METYFLYLEPGKHLLTSFAKFPTFAIAKIGKKCKAHKHTSGSLIA